MTCPAVTGGQKSAADLSTVDGVDAGQKEPARKVQVQSQGSQEASALLLLRE